MYVEVSMTKAQSKKNASWPLSSGGSEFCCVYTGLGLGRLRPYATLAQPMAVNRAPMPRAVFRTCPAMASTLGGTAPDKAGAESGGSDSAGVSGLAAVPTPALLLPPPPPSWGTTRMRAA
jgi:hypothetical protein